MEGVDYLKRISKGAAIIFFGVIIGRFLGYLTRLLIARFYGADGYGLFSLGSAILGIATIISLIGLHQGLPRFISFYKGRGNMEKVRGTIQSGLKITLPLSIVIGLLVFIFSEQISVGFFQEPGLTPLLQLFAFMIPFSVLMENLLGGIRGFQKIQYKTYSEDIFKSLIVILFVPLFFYLGYSVMGAVVAYFLGFVLTCILALYYLNRIFPLKSRIKATSVNRELFSFSWPLIVIGFLWMIVSWTDVITLGVFRTAQEVGIYNVALPTAALLIVILQSFVYIFMPVMSELFSRKRFSELGMTYRSVNRWVFSITLPLFLIMFLFSDTLMGFVFGQEFLMAAIPLSILSIGYFAHSMTGLSGITLTAMGKTRINMVNALAASMSNLFLNIILIPVYGIIGAGIATGISFLTFSIMNQYFCYKYLRFQPFDRNYLKPVLAGIVSMGIFYSLSRHVFQVSGLVLVVMFLAYLALYFLLFLLFGGLDKNDKRILGSLEKKIGSRFLGRIIRRLI